MSRAARKEEHLPRRKERIRLVDRKELGHRAAEEGTEYLRLHALAAEDLRDIDAVHDSREHPDLVGLHASNLRPGSASPVVAAADDNADLDARIDRALDLPRNIPDHRFVIALAVRIRKRFAGKFQHYSSLFHACSAFSLCIFICKYHSTRGAASQACFPVYRR